MPFLVFFAFMNIELKFHYNIIIILIIYLLSIDKIYDLYNYFAEGFLCSPIYFMFSTIPKSIGLLESLFRATVISRMVGVNSLRIRGLFQRAKVRSRKMSKGKGRLPAHQVVKSVGLTTIAVQFVLWQGLSPP